MFSLPAILSLVFLLVAGLGFRAYTGRWELIPEDEKVPEGFDQKAYGRAMGVPLMVLGMIGILVSVLLIAFEEQIPYYISLGILGIGILGCFSWIYSIEKKFKTGRYTSTKRSQYNHRH